jgi:hypothetical protein
VSTATTEQQTMPYRLQFCAGDRDITSDFYCEQDAESVRAWTGAHGDICIVAVYRTPRGRWRIESTDFTLPISAYRIRFPEPADAVAYMARRARAVMAEAECRCGTPGAECD